MSNWTTPAELRAQVEKLWRGGRLLSSQLSGEELFPRRLVLKAPRPAELASRYGEVREWIALLERGSRHYRLVRREVNNRALGSNAVPSQAWIDSREQALALIGKDREAAAFDELVAFTRGRRPELLGWLERRPLKALELAGDWQRFLDVVEWLLHRPRPGTYLRQVDMPGVDTKFIERNRGVLAELLDLALPGAMVDASASGIAGFEARYGFRSKPPRVRLRALDENVWPLEHVSSLPAGSEDQLELTVTATVFSALRLPLERVFITENEINFLAFPGVAASIVVFGGGYGLEALEEAEWLREVSVHYWGDIDTHGFAILDRLRASLPAARSLLMDRETFLAHRERWVSEPVPETRDLARLDACEAALYDDLRHNRLGDKLRLEQELVRFSWVERALGELTDNDNVS